MSKPYFHALSSAKKYGGECTFSSYHSDPSINGFDSYGDRAWGYLDKGQDEGAIDIFGNDDDNRYANAHKKNDIW